MQAQPLYLRKRSERRVRLGHPWVFSNEVDIVRSPLTAFSPGQAAEIYTHGGKFLGTGYVNPHSLICARLISRVGGRYLGRPLLVSRLGEALALRTRLFRDPHYRLVFGESDGLPGLVVDRYGDLLVAQFATAGMECMREPIISALEEVVRPAAIVLRNDMPGRALEGLSAYVESAVGNPPERVEVREDGLRFEVSPLAGQKTGWYYDQRPNRLRLADYVRDRRVLDVFCYGGAWGIRGAAAGARQVTCVDSSASALDQVRSNARLNEVGDTVATIRGDAFEVLKSLRASGERFGVVVLDPPAFIRRKKDVSAGIEAYRRLNGLAMQVLEPGGILVSASCSSHLQRDRLLDVLSGAARTKGLGLQIVEQGHQGPDHPVHPEVPETAYLKVFFARLLGD